ncbi:MAG: MFS transporter [Gammaproteobacteria bacterium]|nr:MFS transporter [Gammaproteobacteria bacterium]MCW8840570.1 MFS transporter [Gammaproteobacteria bacterium]MCW8927541.1 MFS transporter [Gammaproteobacteria bacterium]MCW8958881.1 MFS transporter [Gammaproteobacteria bacterium]MCW8973324.1 MFS transporter [Gammaproteobacteria bacterium]
MSVQSAQHSWRDAWRAWTRPQVLGMLFLGFSAGVPILLIFSSLSLWLREAGVERAAVTYFSWAALGYSFKFVWAPVIDKLPLPLLASLLGQRRAWLLLAQGAVIAAIVLMASIDPAGGESALTLMALAAVMLGFSAATQDIVIDAYRIEAAESELQAMMSATYIAGYRIGMLVAGAGALFLASAFGSSKGGYSYQAWMWSYLCMAGVMLVGVVTTLLIREPDISASRSRYLHGLSAYLRFLLLFGLMVGGLVVTYLYSQPAVAGLKQWLTGAAALNAHFAGFISEALRLLGAAAVALLLGRVAVAVGLARRELLQETYIDPVVEFFRRYGSSAALILLLLVGFYRISDIVLGVVSNVFYQDMGFSKEEIAAVTKTFGLGMVLLGGFVGGTLTVRFGVMRMLVIGALLSALTNLLFLWLAHSGQDLLILTVVIAADNISAGLASAAFVGFLSSLTNIAFTAMQYAIFSSMMTLFPKLLGGYSGGIVDAWGYENFFILTALIGVPVLFLAWYSGRLLRNVSGSVR